MGRGGDWCILGGCFTSFSMTSGGGILELWVGGFTIMVSRSYWKSRGLTDK
jgi:hypothetical protein